MFGKAGFIKKLGGLFAAPAARPVCGEATLANFELPVEALSLAKLKKVAPLGSELEILGTLSREDSGLALGAAGKPLAGLPEAEAALIRRLLGSKTLLKLRVVGWTQAEGQAAALRVRLVVAV